MAAHCKAISYAGLQAASKADSQGVDDVSLAVTTSFMYTVAHNNSMACPRGCPAATAVPAATPGSVLPATFASAHAILLTICRSSFCHGSCRAPLRSWTTWRVRRASGCRASSWTAPPSRQPGCSLTTGAQLDVFGPHAAQTWRNLTSCSVLAQQAMLRFAAVHVLHWHSFP